MVAIPSTLLSLMNSFKNGSPIFKFSGRVSPHKKESPDPLLVTIESLIQETLKEAIQKGKTISLAAINVTKNFFTSDQISYQTKASVVFAAIVLCASPTLRYAIPAVLGPIAGAALSATVSALVSGAFLMYIAATKLAPLALQLLSSQNGVSRPSAQENSQQSSNAAAVAEKKDEQWATEFGHLTDARHWSSSSDKAHESWANEFGDIVKAQDWVSSFEQSEAKKTSAARRSTVVSPKTPSNHKDDSKEQVSQVARSQSHNELQTMVREFMEKKDAPAPSAAATDAIERDVQAFQASSAQANASKNNLPMKETLRAVTILRHLVTPVTREERLQQAFEARKRVNPNLKLPAYQASL